MQRRYIRAGWFGQTPIDCVVIDRTRIYGSTFYMTNTLYVYPRSFSWEHEKNLQCLLNERDKNQRPFIVNEKTGQT